MDDDSTRGGLGVQEPPPLSELLRNAPARRRRSEGSRRQERTRLRRRRARRVLVSVTAVLVGLALVLGGALLWVLDDRLDDVARIPDVFAPLDDAARPAAATDGSTTFLLVGTDVRADGPTTGTDATESGVNGRSDAVLLFRVAGDGSHAEVVSLPRDSWVLMPDGGRDKLNAAYAFGGPTRLVQTVEAITDVRVDHVAVVDFAGFESLTDAVGGVDVQLPEPTVVEGTELAAGPQRLDGSQALAYVRDREDLPGGDLDRIVRQQAYLRGVLAGITGGGVLRDPFRLDDLVDALTRTVSVDDTLSNTDLARVVVGLRDLDAGNTLFLTAPVAGTGTETSRAGRPTSVVYLDDTAGDRLWGFFRDGTLPANQAEFTTPGQAPR